jgi:gliding motility-associated-like protein
LKAAVLREDANFEWYYKEVSKGDSVIAGGEATIITTKSGYYKVKALFGFCESTSRWQHVKFLPSDSLWVPNVFTPNGDSNNDVFKVKTTLSNYEMLILNRYGQEIFSAPGSSSPWNGGDNPAGVYYWYVEYFDCAGKEKVQKGFVQLIR